MLSIRRKKTQTNKPLKELKASGTDTDQGKDGGQMRLKLADWGLVGYGPE